MDRVLIKNAILVDMVKKDEKPKIKDVLIVDGKILRIDNNIKDDNARMIDATGKVLMPGFINAHTHSPMAIFRGYADDSELMDWLQNKIWPIEDKLTKDEVYYSAMLSIMEMLKTGTTTFNDMYFMMESVVEAVKKLNIRSYLGRCIMSVEDPSDTRVKEATKLYNNYDKDGLIRVNIAPHAPYTCNKLALEISRDLSKKLDTPLHIHLDETKGEHDEFIQKYKCSPTRYLEKLGIFDVKTILAHGVWLDDDDIEILKKYNTSIVHNPVSNAKLASGICPVVKYLNSGINVCLGTDGAGSTNNLDMFEEMKLCSYLQKINNLDSSIIDAYKVLEMATINGAKALGLDSLIGTIEVGKEADVIIVDMSRLGLNPINDVYSNLVYACNGSDVEYVLVKGNILLDNKNITLVDEKDIIEKCSQIANKYFS